MAAQLVSPGVLLQVTIDAPTSGWLSLDGGFKAAVGTSLAPLGCELHVDGTNVSGASRIGATVEVLGGQYGGSCQTSGRVEVAAGSHVVTLHSSTTNGGSTASNRSLTAVFAPFDGAGAPAG